MLALVLFPETVLVLSEAVLGSEKRGGDTVGRYWGGVTETIIRSIVM
jgi:hypothetical protein